MGGVFILLHVQTNRKIIMETEEVYILTLSVWNTHRDAYVANKEIMIDW